MKLVTRLEQARAKGHALLAANFYNAETLLAVLRAAERTSSAVILQTSPSTIDYLGLELAYAMARSASAELGIEAYLHLDHAGDLALVRRCLDIGYDSVMIDASEEPVAINIQKTREVVAWAHAAGKTVEAELGYVPKLGQVGVTADRFTTPEEAKSFVAATGVDLLAVAIGSAHGFYKETPRLDFQRLAAIREVVEAPLVLHGSSGLSPDDFRNAVKNGIAKINFATEIKDTFTRALKRSLVEKDEIDLRKSFPPASAVVTDLVAEKMAICANLPARG
jgi:fructose-bisphosphate aldolase class II/tagatose 1,6-diphosphate aldolase GatY/KbaY